MKFGACVRLFFVIPTLLKLDTTHFKPVVFILQGTELIFNRRDVRFHRESQGEIL